MPSWLRSLRAPQCKKEISQQDLLGLLKKGRFRGDTISKGQIFQLFGHGFTQMDTDKFKHKETTNSILKSFYDLYNELGDGSLESLYENALYIILIGYGLCVERQKHVCVFFCGSRTGDFKTNLIVDEKVIIELKAIRMLDRYMRLN